MLAVDKVTIQFGARTLFSDLSFVLRPKDRIALAGPNGAGKSTLMKIVAGIEKPDSGKITKSKTSTVGYLPQEGVSTSGLTVFDEAATAFQDVLLLQEQIDELDAQLEKLDPTSDKYANALEDIGELQLRLEHHDASRMKPQIETVLQGLGFSQGDLQRDCGEFSGGWQMRIALAKLLLLRPRLLLLDEPTNHLDLEARNWLEDFLADYPHAVVLV
ncbi:MAG: ATP-binding cassette domain-containing protein, partial [Verrucomicrobiales bacterium]